MAAFSTFLGVGAGIFVGSQIAKQGFKPDIADDLAALDQDRAEVDRLRRQTEQQTARQKRRLQAQRRLAQQTGAVNLFYAPPVGELTIGAS